MENDELIISTLILDRITGNPRRITDYTSVAELRGHQVLDFIKFGWFEGTWLMLSRFGNNLYIWKDRYGSCPACDPLKSKEPFNNVSKIINFVKNYEPFAEISLQNAQSFVSLHKFTEILPANFRDFMNSQVDYIVVTKKWSGLIKNEKEV